MHLSTWRYRAWMGRDHRDYRSICLEHEGTTRTHERLFRSITRNAALVLCRAVYVDPTCPLKRQHCLYDRHAKIKTASGHLSARRSRYTSVSSAISTIRDLEKICLH